MLTANEILEWDDEGTTIPAKPLLVVDGLVKHFPIRSWMFGRARATVRAVDGLTFTVNHGETLGIAGASGCGKSTSARLLMHLIKPDSGKVIWRGLEVGSVTLPVKCYRRDVQVILQNTNGSLDPRLTIERSIALGPAMHGLSRNAANARARSVLARVGLEPKIFAGRYPHELNDGQRQRVNVARTLALDPKLLILDDAVAGLDKAIAVPLLDLLQDLRQEFGLTYIVMAQDMTLAGPMCDRTLTMELGRIAETTAN